MEALTQLSYAYQAIIIIIVTILIIAMMFLVAYTGLNKMTQLIANRYPNEKFFLIIRFIRTPVILGLIILVIGFSSYYLKVQLIYNQVVHHLLKVVIIILAAGFIISSITLIRKIFLYNYDIGLITNIIARRLYTQLQVCERIIKVFILIIACAAILMTFQPIRQFGFSILASAGLLTAIIGFAAQKSLASLLAGFQVAVTQPIRINDVVVVEGEWGTIEEINLSYVVMRIWDKRRLIIPINYFLEKTFQNWSRCSTDLLGTVFLYTDYRVPIGELTKELSRIVRDSPLWDGAVSIIQMTDVKTNLVELRVLISASNSSDLFNLRCIVREKLTNYIARYYPEYLPKSRFSFSAQDG